MPPDERFIVVEGLLRSLDLPDQKVDDIWAEEAERRMEEIRQGKVQPLDGESVMRELRSRSR